jgi:uncharacterized protein (DUF111 family)
MQRKLYKMVSAADQKSELHMAEGEKGTSAEVGAIDVVFRIMRAAAMMGALTPPT